MKSDKLPKRRNSGGVTLALFPFLAVLVCAMGALIVILVLVTRQARLQACEMAASKASEQETQLRQNREDIRWKIEKLKSSRQASETQLAELRMQLGHLEDHARRLHQRLAELQAAHDQLKQGDSSVSQQRSELEAQLEKLKKEIEEAKRQRDKAEAESAHRKRSYAIVPFEGVNGTRRRPIYIECLADAVILQPEGIRLTVADFDGPMGPGNPLAASIRAIREYWVMHDGFDPEKSGEPYPLLLVRPEGIVAYYVCRDALKSWNADQGYELIGDDWTVAYPTQPDPSLAKVVEDTLRTARQRQQDLIAAAPRAYSGPTRQRYRAAPGGGIMPDGDTPEPSSRRSGRYPGSGLGRDGDAGSDTRDSSPSGGSAGGLAAGSPGGTVAGASGTAGAAGSADGSALPGMSGNSTTAPATDDGSTGSGQGRPQDWALMGTPREQSVPSPDQQLVQVTPKPGYWEPSPPPPPPKSDKDKDKDKPPEQDLFKSERDFASDRDSPQFNASVPVGGRKLADVRGAGWGLRDAARGAVGITRPIQVECYADRLVLVPEGGTGAGSKSINWGPRSADSIDAFVSAVWEFMDGWGIAGRGMYWKPVLRVSVAPGAEERYQDLQRLLAGSGLDVVRR